MAFTPKLSTKVSTIAIAAAGLAMAGAASAQDVNIGFLGGVTGPIAELVPPIVEASQMAVDQINEAGGILGGQTANLVVADSQCASQGAVDGANRLINVDQVAGIVGALCSGAAIAAANSVAIPADVMMISPSATSPEITNLDDNDTFFRVAPSDAYQGQVLADYVLDNGFDRVALTYINNDYGAGLASAFRDAYTARGGEITADLVHEENRSSYRSELATLSGDDPEALVLLAYASGSGLTMIRQSLENGFFDTFIGADGMRNDILIEQLGAENLNILLTQPVSLPDNPALDDFNAAFEARDQDPNSIFVAQGYDAAMLIALAVEYMGGVDREAMPEALRHVANAPGEEVGPGDWARAVELLAAGEDINYQGASGPVEFDDAGNVPGLVAEFMIEGDTFVQGDILDLEGE